MENLSTRIQVCRKKLNISQQDLALKINVSKSMINRYETKGVQPPADVLNRIATVLETSVDYLINGEAGDKAKSTLKDVELLTTLKEIDVMPEKEKSMLLHYMNVYISICYNIRWNKVDVSK